MENKKEKISNNESIIRQKLIEIVKKNRETHIWTPDIKIRYLILKILSRLARTYYVVPSDHVDSISLFLDQWEDFGIKTESAVYPRDLNQSVTSKLVITSEDYLLDLMTHSDNFKFAGILIFDNGFETSSKNMIINHIWRKYTDSKPRLVHFSPPNELNNNVHSLGHYSHRVMIVYTREDLENIYDKTAELILNRYISLTRGCCIVVFVANIDQEIELRDRLIQIEDNILSVITSDDVTTKKEDNRPKIIITNYSFDVRSLADVSIVIDLMMDEENHKIRYISKHKADERLKRVNMDNGICFRMISFNSYQQLLEVHHGYFEEYHQLLLLNSGVKNFIDISKPDVSLYQKLKLIKEFNISPSMKTLPPNILTTLGQQASVLPIKPQTFSFVNSWKNSVDNGDIFPAIVISSLLEFGDTIVSREKRHQLYYGKDDVETFLNVYLDLLNEYKGIPSMEDYDSIVWVQKWSNERGFDYESIRRINLFIREIYQRFNSEGYSSKISPFLLQTTMKKMRELAGFSYPVAQYEDGAYVGEDGTRYILNENQYHTIQKDQPDKIIILSSTGKKDLNIKLALSTENTTLIPILDIPNYPISKLITKISDYAAGINFSDYIDLEIDAEDKIQTISIQRENEKKVSPKYELWLDETPPINKFTVKDGDLYTHQEVASINIRTSFVDVIDSDSKELKFRSIDFILDATVTWEDRGNLLVIREYITKNVPNGDLILIVGNFNQYTSDSFPEINFVVYTDGYVKYSDNVKSRGTPYNVKNYKSNIRPHLIINMDMSVEDIKSILDILDIKTAMVPFGNLNEELLDYEGIIKIVPFLDKQSTDAKLVIGTKIRKKYESTKYKNQMFYHNLVNRQWNLYKPQIPFPSRNNLYKPERDYICHDRCYDCRRELGIHLDYLKRHNEKQAYDDKIETYDEIDRLSIFLRHRRSLYRGMHGMFTGIYKSMEYRREEYRKYLIERKQNKFNAPSLSRRPGLKIV